MEKEAGPSEKIGKDHALEIGADQTPVHFPVDGGFCLLNLSVQLFKDKA